MTMRTVLTTTAALLFAATFLAAWPATSPAAGDLGAARIEIPGGQRGPVPFPHQQHQQALEDCNLCHATFPQKAGGIAERVAAGQLKKKEVMNKQCIRCHRARKKAGNSSGPTSCKKCHIKK